MSSVGTISGSSNLTTSNLNVLNLSKTVSVKLKDDEIVETFSIMATITADRTLTIAQSRTIYGDEEDDDMAPTSWWKNVSASMYALLIVVFLDAMCAEMYFIAYPVVFETDFGISTTVTGYVNIAGNIFSYLMLSVMVKYTNRWKLFQYPCSIIIGMLD